MKTANKQPFKLLLFVALLIFNNQFSTILAQGITAFTYQGQLKDNSTNANGTYKMILKLYDAASNGNQIGGSITNSPTLANGLFTMNLDFGAGAFNGGARWLDITVSIGTTTQTLTPRVQILPTSYSQFAAVAANVTNGAITTVQIANGAVSDTKIVSVSGSKVAGSVALASFATNASIATTAGIATTASSVAANSIATASLQDSSITDAKITSVSALKISGTVANTANITNGSWNSSVGSVLLYGTSWPNIFGLFCSNSLVFGMSFNGPYAPGSFHVGNQLYLGDSSTTIGYLYYTNKYGVVIGNAVAGYAATVNGNLNVVGTVYQSSDRNLKEQLMPINSLEILKRVVGLPISSWNFKMDTSTRHIGPMAQDFYAAFNVGADDRHIATVDEGGVALAAIQGLNEKLEEQRSENVDLKARLEKLERLLNQNNEGRQ